MMMHYQNNLHLLIIIYDTAWVGNDKRNLQEWIKVLNDQLKSFDIKQTNTFQDLLNIRESLKKLQTKQEYQEAKRIIDDNINVLMAVNKDTDDLLFEKNFLLRYIDAPDRNDEVEILDIIINEDIGNGIYNPTNNNTSTNTGNNINDTSNKEEKNDTNKLNTIAVNIDDWTIKSSDEQEGNMTGITNKISDMVLEAKAEAIEKITDELDVICERCNVHKKIK